MPAALEKLENHFGKIPEKKRAMVHSLSKRELLLRQLSRKVVIKKESRFDGPRIHFFIPSSSTENIVDAMIRPIVQDNNLHYELELLSLGTLKKGSYEGVNRLAKDKREGKGGLLLRIIIAYARRNGVKSISLNCEKEEVPFYEKFGFIALPNNGLMYEETMVLDL